MTPPSQPNPQVAPESHDPPPLTPVSNTHAIFSDHGMSEVSYQSPSLSKGFFELSSRFAAP